MVQKHLRNTRILFHVFNPDVCMNVFKGLKLGNKDLLKEQSCMCDAAQRKLGVLDVMSYLRRRKKLIVTLRLF